ncbi:MAG: hypothetical protein CM15mP93_03980 [Thiotrichaceae bacterium]|nr:MAG: hypothetical protein CM15mP93_03980 [Thiotrichaceae bacterium]
MIDMIMSMDNDGLHDRYDYDMDMLDYMIDMIMIWTMMIT